MGKAVRIIFSVFSVVMIGLFAWRVSTGEWTAVNWGMLGISALCCLMVFRMFLHIFTYTYGWCCLLNAALIWAALPSPATALVAGAIVIYGLRFLLFFWIRDRSASYSAKIVKIREDDRAMPLGLKIMFWFMVTWLMTFHLMALWFVGVSGELNAGVIAGAAVMLGGTLLEGLADWQKHSSKERAPEQLVAHGLFARWRHPNYMGEILLQTGLIIAGLSSVSGPVAGVMAVVSPLYIAILMVTEAGRLDGEQQQRYGDQDNYRQYRARSGSLFPRFG